jgi:ankyrin
MESIHELVRKGDVDQVARLIDDNPELLEARDEHDWYPIHVAAECGNISIVRLFIERGVDVNIRTEEGEYFTPLDLAASSGSAELVRYLSNVGACLDLRDDYFFTPIHTAAIYGRPRALEVLLQNGADPNDRVNGMTPRSYAELYLYSVDFRPPSSKYVPPATREDYRECVDILLRYGGVV